MNWEKFENAAAGFIWIIIASAYCYVLFHILLWKGVL